MGAASLGPGTWLNAAQIPAGGDVSSMNPIETRACARMRGAKLTASKYPAVRRTSGRSTSQLGYGAARSEEHTSELQSPCNLVCRLLLEKKNKSHCQPNPRSRSSTIIHQLYAVPRHRLGCGPSYRLPPQVSRQGPGVHASLYRCQAIVP